MATPTIDNKKNWSWKPEDSFDNILEDLEKWINENGRLPIRSSNDENEKYLAKWCDRQRRKAILGKLSDDEIEKLYKIKEWTWGIKGYEDYLARQVKKATRGMY